MGNHIEKLFNDIKNEYSLEKDLYDDLMLLNCKLKEQFDLSLGALLDNDYSKVPNLILARMNDIFSEQITTLLCKNYRSYNALARMILENAISLLVIAIAQYIMDLALLIYFM